MRPPTLPPRRQELGEKLLVVFGYEPYRGAARSRTTASRLRNSARARQRGGRARRGRRRRAELSSSTAARWMRCSRRRRVRRADDRRRQLRRIAAQGRDPRIDAAQARPPLERPVLGGSRCRRLIDRALPDRAARSRALPRRCRSTHRSSCSWTTCPTGSRCRPGRPRQGARYTSARSRSACATHQPPADLAAIEDIIVPGAEWRPGAHLRPHADGATDRNVSVHPRRRLHRRRHRVLRLPGAHARRTHGMHRDQRRVPARAGRSVPAAADDANSIARWVLAARRPTSAATRHA